MGYLYILRQNQMALSAPSALTVAIDRPLKLHEKLTRSAESAIYPGNTARIKHASGVDFKVIAPLRLGDSAQIVAATNRARAIALILPRRSPATFATAATGVGHRVAAVLARRMP